MRVGEAVRGRKPAWMLAIVAGRRRASRTSDWLPKPGVVGSSPIVRSRIHAGLALFGFLPVPDSCPKPSSRAFLERRNEQSPGDVDQDRRSKPEPWSRVKDRAPTESTAPKSTVASADKALPASESTILAVRGHWPRVIRHRSLKCRRRRSDATVATLSPHPSDKSGGAWRA